MLDHILVALRSATQTHYGLTVGVAGNWAFAVFDLTVMGMLYVLHRRLERPGAVAHS